MLSTAGLLGLLAFLVLRVGTLLVLWRIDRGSARSRPRSC